MVRRASFSGYNWIVVDPGDNGVCEYGWGRSVTWGRGDRSSEGGGVSRNLRFLACLEVLVAAWATKLLSAGTVKRSGDR